MVRSSPRTGSWLAALALSLPAWAAAADSSVPPEPPPAPQARSRAEAPPRAEPAVPAAPAVPADARRRADGNCPDSGNAVAVLTRKRELWLCTGGAPEQRIQVALGHGGLDKRRKGDGRTPIGTYELGNPRPSSQFGIFIPIEYPTREQAARGHTGGTLGIHGPPRGKAEPRYPTTAFDWTLGCVATGTDEDIEVIARFVRERQPVVVIR